MTAINNIHAFSPPLSSYPKYDIESAKADGLFREMASSRWSITRPGCHQLVPRVDSTEVRKMFTIVYPTWIVSSRNGEWLIIIFVKLF